MSQPPPGPSPQTSPPGSPRLRTASNPCPAPTHLYKILPSAPPSPLPSHLPLSDLDAASGFIHLSTAAQVPRTAARFFDAAQTLWVLVVRCDVFDAGDGRVVWEEADGELFPHLYGGGLGRGMVREVREFERGVEGWERVIVVGEGAGGLVW